MIPLLLLVGEAMARAGGGQGYGGGSSGGSSSGGSSGGGDDGLGLLLWLVFQHPVIGIPILIVVAIVYFSQRHATSRTKERRVVRSDAPPPASRVPDLAALRAVDPLFSLPLFLDLARLVYVRAHEARGRNDAESVRAYVAPEVFQTLRARNAATSEVREVILGATNLAAVAFRGDDALLTVYFETNLTEVVGAHRQQWLVRERWTFTRAAGARSPGPDRMRTLSCVSCGSPAETTTNGRCRSCDTVLDDGRLQWRVGKATLVHQEALHPIALEPGVGVEAGTRNPIVQAPDLPVRLRELQARHPDFQWAAFRARVVDTFQRIQGAWSDQAYEKARPLETDFLFQQHRYWIERYRAEGLRNRLDKVRVTDVVPAKVELDAYVEAITVRVFASMRDWTEDRAGKVVGGSRTGDRVFSEYWTFLRTAEAARRTGAPAGDHAPDQCPSCGAPLDKVNETGVCGYCDAKITGGDFDWVLSAIDQDEAYRG